MQKLAFFIKLSKYTLHHSHHYHKLFSPVLDLVNMHFWLPFYCLRRISKWIYQNLYQRESSGYANLIPQLLGFFNWCIHLTFIVSNFSKKISNALLQRTVCICIFFESSNVKNKLCFVIYFIHYQQSQKARQ